MTAAERKQFIELCRQVWPKPTTPPTTQGGCKARPSYVPFDEYAEAKK
jgi:hypothetical protein